MKIYNFTLQALKSNYLLITIFMIALPLVLLPFFKILPSFLLIVGLVVLTINLVDIKRAQHYVYINMGSRFYEVFCPTGIIKISDNEAIEKEILYYYHNGQVIDNNKYNISKIDNITHKDRVKRSGIKKLYSYYFITIDDKQKHIDAIYYKHDVRLTEAFKQYIKNSKHEF